MVFGPLGAITLSYPGMMSDTGGENFVSNRYTPVLWSSSAFVTLPLIVWTLPVTGEYCLNEKETSGLSKSGFFIVTLRSIWSVLSAVKCFSYSPPKKLRTLSGGAFISTDNSAITFSGYTLCSLTKVQALFIAGKKRVWYLSRILGAAPPQTIERTTITREGMPPGPIVN